MYPTTQSFDGTIIYMIVDMKVGFMQLQLICFIGVFKLFDVYINNQLTQKLICDLISQRIFYSTN